MCPAKFRTVEPLETQKRGASPLGQIHNWKENGSKRQVSMSCVRHLTTRFPLESWGERRREVEGQGKVEVLQGGGLDGGDLCIRDKASGRRASSPLAILSNTPFSTSHPPKSCINFILSTKNNFYFFLFEKLIHVHCRKCRKHRKAFLFSNNHY